MYFYESGTRIFAAPDGRGFMGWIPELLGAFARGSSAGRLTAACAVDGRRPLCYARDRRGLSWNWISCGSSKSAEDL
jgi:hypothetical protein